MAAPSSKGLGGIIDLRASPMPKPPPKKIHTSSKGLGGPIDLKASPRSKPLPKEIPKFKCFATDPVEIEEDRTQKLLTLWEMDRPILPRCQYDADWDLWTYDAGSRSWTYGGQIDEIEAAVEADRCRLIEADRGTSSAAGYISAAQQWKQV